MTRPRDTGAWRACAVAFLPVLAFGTRFKVDTRLKLGGGYFAMTEHSGCGDQVDLERAWYGAASGQVRLQYDLFVATLAGAIAAGRFSRDTTTGLQGKTSVAPSGILRVGADLTWWSGEVGIALGTIDDFFVAPSAAFRMGPRPFHFLIGWWNRMPIGWFYPLESHLRPPDFVLYFPNIGLGSETDQWSAKLVFSIPGGLNATGSLVWKAGRLGFGAEAGIMGSGSVTYKDESGRVLGRFGPEDNMAAYLFLVLTYSR